MAILTYSPVQANISPELVKQVQESGNPIGSALSGLSKIALDANTYYRDKIADDWKRYENYGKYIADVNAFEGTKWRTENPEEYARIMNQAFSGPEGYQQSQRDMAQYSLPPSVLDDFMTAAGTQLKTGDTARKSAADVRQSDAAARASDANAAYHNILSEGAKIQNASAQRAWDITQEHDDIQRRISMLDPEDRAIIMNAFSNPARRVQAIDLLQQKTGYKRKYLSDSEIYDNVTGKMVKADTTNYDTAMGYLDQIQKQGQEWFATPRADTGLAPSDFTINGKDDLAGLDTIIRNMPEEQRKGFKEKVAKNLPNIMAQAAKKLPDGTKNLPKAVQAKLLLQSIRGTESDKLPQWIKFLNGESTVAPDTVVDWKLFSSLATGAVKQYSEDSADINFWKPNGQAERFFTTHKTDLLNQKNKASAYDIDEMTGAVRPPQSVLSILDNIIRRFPAIAGLTPEQQADFANNFTRSLTIGGQVPLISQAKLRFPASPPQEKQNNPQNNPQDASIVSIPQSVIDNWQPSVSEAKKLTQEQRTAMRNNPAISEPVKETLRLADEQVKDNKVEADIRRRISSASPEDLANTENMLQQISSINSISAQIQIFRKLVAKLNVEISKARHAKNPLKEQVLLHARNQYQQQLKTIPRRFY